MTAQRTPTNVKDNAPGAAWVKDTWSRLSASVEGPKLVPVKTTVFWQMCNNRSRWWSMASQQHQHQGAGQQLTPPRVFSVVTEGVTFRTAGGMYDDT